MKHDQAADQTFSLQPKPKNGNPSKIPEPFTHYDTAYSQNRELSWLRFNERVLEEATDQTVPLYEQLKFISIFTSNLDEFFMIRVGSLHDISLLKSEHIDNKTGMTAAAQLSAIFRATAPLYQKRDTAYSQVCRRLESYGIADVTIEEMNQEERKYVDRCFKRYIRPVLSPKIVDTRHRFPHLPNKCLSITATLEREGRDILGIIPLPASLPRILPLLGKKVRYVRLEEIIKSYTEQIFDGYTVKSKAIIRVTRNADISPDDDSFDMDEDFRLHMRKILRKRPLLAPVRLEYQGSLDCFQMEYLPQRLNLTKEQIFKSKTPLDLSYVFGLESKLPPPLMRDLTYPAFRPAPARMIHSGESIWRQAQRKDLLLFYPYEDMNGFLRMIKEASEDDSVLSIQIVLYRVAPNSTLMDYLCIAARRKKNVTVLIELRARFDEQNNIHWADRLEDAGCKVIYGIDGYKVHAKICLITRRERDQIQYLTQVGTGNYNEKTAKLYTDFSLITARKDIGEDASRFFKNIAIANLDGNYKQLLVAPNGLKSHLMAMVEEEIAKGPQGEIFFKLNAITERDMIDKLMEASQAGVKVTLLIRGICCILPGISGKTENVSVYSIVGRFLEHSRIYRFGKEENCRMYISSADLMTRNLIRRVELACPIQDQEILEEINRIIRIHLADTAKIRQMNSNGTYSMLPLQEGEIPFSSQRFFTDEYRISVDRLPAPYKNTSLFDKLFRFFTGA